MNKDTVKVKCVVLKRPTATLFSCQMSNLQTSGVHVSGGYTLVLRPLGIYNEKLSLKWLVFAHKHTSIMCKA